MKGRNIFFLIFIQDDDRRHNTRESAKKIDKLNTSSSKSKGTIPLPETAIRETNPTAFFDSSSSVSSSLSNERFPAVAKPCASFEKITKIKTEIRELKITNESPKPEPVAGETRKHGFERGLQAEVILGMTNEEVAGKIHLLIKWKGCPYADFVLAEHAYLKCPMLVLKFYESLLHWPTDEKSASEAKTANGNV